MNIKQLRLFHEVLTTGKMSSAAERLNFSQPAASKMLANLEARIGYRLFFRQNGQLNATPEALYLHQEVMTVLQSLKRLEDSFDRAKSGQLGRLNIAGLLGPTCSFVPRIFDSYAQENSHLKLNLQVFNSVVIRESVASGQFELGFADKGAASSRYDSQCFDLPCYCALHRDHPAANMTELSPGLLDGEAWITLDPEHVTYHTLKKHYLAVGAEFRPEIEVNVTLHALAFVRQRRGIALVDAINLKYYTEIFPQEEVVFRRFTPKITEPLELISINSRPLSKPAADLRTMFLTELELLCNLE
jgi:DNA-binding transcriptional LysR family regulator